LYHLAEFYIGKRGFGQEKKDHEAKKILLPADGSLIMKLRSAPDPSGLIFLGINLKFETNSNDQNSKNRNVSPLRAEGVAPGAGAATDMIDSSRKGPATVAGILLMAGRSSRLGFPKALLPFGSGRLVEWTLARVLPSRLSSVILVLGAHRLRIGRAVASFQGHPKLKVLFNPDFAQGMSTSLRKGLEAVPADVSGVMFILGDQPLIRTTTLNRLIAAFTKSGAPIVAPLYGGLTGNPVIFRRDLLPELKRQRGDVGGRKLIKKYGAAVQFLPIRPAYQGWDLDTWEDYEKIKDRLSRLRGNKSGLVGPSPTRKQGGAS
jgi:molybdenum cofactor cytidylyltransferase